MTKEQAQREAQALADEAREEFFLVREIGGGFRALPFRPLWGHVLAVIGPREVMP